MIGTTATRSPADPATRAAWHGRWAGASPNRALAEAREPGTGEPLGWGELYRRLARDSNDAAAFAALERRVAGWAERQLTSPAVRGERPDVVAETCAAVVVGLVDVRAAASFAGFVYGHYLNGRRRALRGSRWPTVSLGDLDPPALGVEDPSTDELALLARWLGELPPRERRAVELRYLGEASTAEIAAALGVSEAYARRLVFKGLARLRRSARQAWPAGRG